MQREPFDAEREVVAYTDPAFRQGRRAALYELLGDLLATRGDQVTVVEQRTEDHGDDVVERPTLELNGTEPVPAVLLKPAKSPAVAPTLVIYNHAHWDDFERGKPAPPRLRCWPIRHRPRADRRPWNVDGRHDVVLDGRLDERVKACVDLCCLTDFQSRLPGRRCGGRLAATAI